MLLFRALRARLDGRRRTVLIPKQAVTDSADRSKMLGRDKAAPAEAQVKTLTPEQEKELARDARMAGIDLDLSYMDKPGGGYPPGTMVDTPNGPIDLSTLE